MSSIRNTGAMENLFDAEQTTVTLLEAVKANVANTVKTVDAAASLENKLSEEAAQFNACLTTMSNAIRKCERGEISREEMLAECAPCVTALKEKCVALKLSNVKVTGNDITEEEIAMLREYIVGCKDIIADRKKELQDSPVEATEGVLAGLANFEPATEAIKMWKEIRNSTEAKTAAQLYKQAKKLYGLGSKEQALTYLKKAQDLYESCLKKAEENAKMFDVERTQKSADQEYKYTEKMTKNSDMAYVIEYFEDRVDSCKALEMQWNNKAGKSTYAETKAQLKAERKQVKRDRREARKAERAAKKNGGNAEERTEASEAAIISAMESLMNTLELELALESAMEAEGEEQSDAGKKASGIGAKLRAAFGKMKKAKEEGDTSEVAQAEREINEATSELEEAADAAETPEEKAKLSKAAKIGIAAAAAVVVAAGVGTAIAVKAKKTAEGENVDPKKAGGLIKQLKDAIKNAKDDAYGRYATATSKTLRADRAIQKEERKVAAAQDYLAKKMAEGRERSESDKANAINKAAKAYDKMKNKAIKKGTWGKSQDSYTDEDSILSAMAFGLEGVMVEDEDINDDEVETLQGKAFDDEDLIEDANESELDDLATEAAIAVMLAEDGIDDSDLI